MSCSFFWLFISKNRNVLDSLLSHRGFLFSPFKNIFSKTFLDMLGKFSKLIWFSDFSEWYYYGDIDSNTLNIYKHYCQSTNFRIKARVNWVTFSTTLLPLLTFLQAFAVFYEIVANILQHDKHLDDISIMWSLKTTASDITIGTKSEHLIL